MNNEQNLSAEQMKPRKYTLALQQRIHDLSLKCPTIADLSVMLSPMQQPLICTDKRRCYLADYPTLSMLNATYGEWSASQWLVPHLFNLSEYSGCKGKLNELQLRELAVVIAKEFYYLKTSEFMLFCFRFKAGYYGNFYGSVDPVKIMECLNKQFIRERAKFYDEYEQEKAEKRREQQKQTGMTYAEYCKKHGIEPKVHGAVTLRRVPSVRQKRELTTEQIFNIAKELTLNENKLEESTLETLSNQFTRKYGETPKEYVVNHNNY